MDEKNINFSKWRFSRWVVVFFWVRFPWFRGTTWCLFWESTCVARWCVSRLHFFAVYRAIKSYPNYTRGFFHTPKNKDPYVVTSSTYGASVIGVFNSLPAALLELIRLRILRNCSVNTRRFVGLASFFLVTHGDLCFVVSTWPPTNTR